MWSRVDTVLLTIVMNSFFGHTYGRTITCACTTPECEEQNTNLCNTTGQCYTQFLDLKDGSNPILRGCIVTKTPLLCENRRPAINTNWPVLSCCSTNMCNQDNVMAVPPKLTPTGPEKYSANAPNSSTSSGTSIINDSPEINKKTASSSEMDSAATPSKGVSNGTVTIDNDPQSSKIISPVYIAVLVIGICSLIVIGIVAVFMLRKHGRLYDSDYGAMERNSYSKGHHQVAREDPELQMPLPRAANGIYDNKLAVGT